MYFHVFTSNSDTHVWKEINLSYGKGWKEKYSQKRKRKKKGKEDHGYEFILRLKLQDYKCLPLTAIAWKEKKW